jgi:hypothetical protein
MGFRQAHGCSESDATIGTGSCATGYFLMATKIEEGFSMGNSANNQNKTSTSQVRQPSQQDQQGQNRNNNNSADSNKSGNKTSRQNAQGGGQPGGAGHH